MFTSLKRPCILKLNPNRPGCFSFNISQLGTCTEQSGSLGISLGLRHFLSDSDCQNMCPLKWAGYLNFFLSTSNSSSRALTPQRHLRAFTQVDLFLPFISQPFFLKIVPPLRLASSGKQSFVFSKGASIAFWLHIFLFWKDQAQKLLWDKIIDALFHMVWTQIYFFLDGNFSNAHKIYGFPKSVSHKKHACIWQVNLKLDPHVIIP